MKGYTIHISDKIAAEYLKENLKKNSIFISRWVSFYHIFNCHVIPVPSVTLTAGTFYGGGCGPRGKWGTLRQSRRVMPTLSPIT